MHHFYSKYLKADSCYQRVEANHTTCNSCRLLDVLAARKGPRGLSGDILINGNPRPANFTCTSGYVPQVSAAGFGILDCMKCQRIIVVVHLNISIIFFHCFLNTFKTEAMPAMIRLVGGKAFAGTHEGIFPAGIFDGDHSERCFFVLARTDFNESVGNSAGSRKRIVQQIAEEGGEVMIGDKIDTPMSDISVKRNLLVVALPFVPAQDRVQHFVAA